MWIERLRAEWAGRYCALANSGSLHCGGSLSLLAGPSEPREPLRNAAAMPYQTLAALNRYARGPHSPSSAQVSKFILQRPMCSMRGSSASHKKTIQDLLVRLTKAYLHNRLPIATSVDFRVMKPIPKWNVA